MARKQQRTSPKKIGLDEIRRHRLELEAQIREVQQAFFAIQKEFAELQDEKAVQQHRRKLRYPAT